MYIYVYLYIYILTYWFVSIYIHISIRSYYIYITPCVRICTYRYIYILYTYIHIYIHIIYIYTYICTYTYIQIYIQIHIYICLSIFPGEKLNFTFPSFAPPLDVWHLSRRRWLQLQLLPVGCEKRWRRTSKRRWREGAGGLAVPWCLPWKSNVYIHKNPFSKKM